MIQLIIHSQKKRRPGTSSGSGSNGSFQYSLAQDTLTSAIVKDTNGVTVRTLWSGEKQLAGANTGYWDGKDDYGVFLPDANYTIIVGKANGVTYTWKNTIGNNSTNLTGPTKHRNISFIQGLAISGNTCYYAHGYGEGPPATTKFNVSTPGQKTWIRNYGTQETVTHVCTDGTRVYWGGLDPFNGTKSFVFATKVSDDLEYTFSAGTSVGMTYGTNIASGISIVNSVGGDISGMKVQNTGNYLFVARKSPGFRIAGRVIVGGFKPVSRDGVSAL